MTKFRKFAATSQGTKYLAKGWACQDFSGALDFDNVQIKIIFTAKLAQNLQSKKFEEA